MCIFAPGPAAVPRSFFVSPICFTSLSHRYRPAFPERFEFQIPRDHRVDRRGNNRLSSVSTRLCAVICFRRPSPLRLYVTDTAIYGAVSLVTPHFYLWRHPVCIRIDSVIYFAADSDASPRCQPARKGEFRDCVSISFTSERCVRRNDYVIIFSRLYLTRQSLFVRSFSYARGARIIIADWSCAHAYNENEISSFPREK